MITDEAEKQRRIDLLSYQVQEIEDAGLTAGEEQTLESRRKILANASAIRDKIAQSYALLSGDDEAPAQSICWVRHPMQWMLPRSWMMHLPVHPVSCWICITMQRMLPQI